MQFPKAEISAVKQLIESSKNIVITTHHRPDGDAMGSSLGLYNYLKLKGCNVNVITPSDYPDFLTWLPSNDVVINFEAAGHTAKELVNNADLIFCLDFNWLSRVEGMEGLLRSAAAKKVLIDHHLDPENVYDFVFSFTEACSTSELIYRFIDALGDVKMINKDIAECLYCGIMTDTNSFRYSSMKADVHRIIAELMEAGAENYRIHERVYDTSTENRLRLLGFSLKEKLTVLPEFNTAYLALSQAELEMFNHKSGDTEGLVNYALSINGIKFAAFFSEKDGMIKISFRSKGNFSVKEFSGKYFSGGGHKNASGGRSDLSLSDTLKKFLDLLPVYKNELNSVE
jgi:phosphoesterase RecJ-like protein